MGKQWKQCQTLFLGLQNHCRWWLQPWNQKTLTPWKGSYDQPRKHIKKQRHYFANKCLSSQSDGFFSSHIWMWELDYKESWAAKSLQSCLTLCSPIDGSPPGSAPWDSPGKNTGVGCHFLLHKESGESKNWCFWTVVLEKTLESPLDYKEIQPVHSEGDQPWDFFGRTDVEAETPILWLWITYHNTCLKFSYMIILGLLLF